MMKLEQFNEVPDDAGYLGYLVLPKENVRRLHSAAESVQAMLDDGSLGAAFGGGDDRTVDYAVTVFDALKEATGDVSREFRHTSPFLRYRREFFGFYETAGRLRALVMNLWGGRPVNLSALFQGADEHHTRIALECIASYTQYGENDTFFMTLADEINELPPVREVSA